MRRILVTAISGNVANGILKALRDTRDEVYGCDIYDYPVGMSYVKAFWKSELAVSETYISAMIAKCKEYKITHLIPVNELEIRKISEHRDEFEAIGIKLIINSPEIIYTFLDKKLTIEYLQRAGIPVPRTYTMETFQEDGKPYIVKLRNSCGSKLLERVSSKTEILKLGIKEEFVIQEYLEEAEEEYTVGVFSDGEQVDIISFKRKLEHGYTSFVELVQNERIAALAKRIAQAVTLRGFINIQLRKSGDEYKVFEINPRISGTVYFRHMLEFSDVLWWLDLADGIRREKYVPQYAKAIGMRELSEKFVILEKNK